MNASLADRSGTLPVAWSLHLVSRGCHRRGLAAGASDSKSRLTDLGSVTYKVRDDSKSQALLLFSRHLRGLLG